MMKKSNIFDELGIHYKMQGADYYVLDGINKEVYIDGDSIYFFCGNMLVRKSLTQKTIKRIIKAYVKGKRIWAGEY